MQAQSANSSDIAVGHQHKHKSMTNALTNIYHLNGIPGLWRGVHVAMSRVMVGSAIQLSTFTNTKEYIVSKQVCTHNMLSLQVSFHTIMYCIDNIEMKLGFFVSYQ